MPTVQSLEKEYKDYTNGADFPKEYETMSTREKFHWLRMALGI